MKKSQLIVVFLVGILALFVVGCRMRDQNSELVSPSANPGASYTVEPSQPSTNAMAKLSETPANTLSPTKTYPPLPTPTPLLTSSFTMTPTPEPTLSVEESKAYVLEQLQNNGQCKFPCFWGVVPQQTPIDEVKLLLQHLGWKWSYYKDPLRNNLATGSGIIYDEFGVVGSFEDVSGIVGSISIQIGVGKQVPFVPFSMKQILSTYGIPERIELGLVYVAGFEAARPTTGYTLWIFYDEQGIMLRYVGTAVKLGPAYRICPTDLNLGIAEKEGSGNVSLVLKSPKDDRSLRDVGEIHGGAAGGTLPISKAAGLSVEEFYNQLLAKEYGPYCFETPFSAWP